MKRQVGNYNLRYSLAKRIAQSLDNSDKNNKKGIIDADTWNIFAAGKGNSIERFIRLDDAIKSICTYLRREARKTGQSLSSIANIWQNEIVSNTAEITSEPITSRKSDSQPKPEMLSSSDGSSDVYDIDNSYMHLDKKQAEQKAKNDKKLERLDGGEGWEVSEDSFRTDIKYARKYTGKILTYISKLIGAKLIITSALGTKGVRKRRTPHNSRRNKYISHHNAANPKLDVKAENINLSELQKRLLATGFFNRVSYEPSHLDVQIKPEVYLAYENNIEGKDVLAFIQNQSAQREFSA